MGFIERVLEWLARLAEPLADLIREVGRFVSFVLEARNPRPIGATA